jgi:Holliday junction resolvase-like predicted endonuclease
VDEVESDVTEWNEVDVVDTKSDVMLFVEV